MYKRQTEDRIPEIKKKFGVGYCNITKCCTEICPENIDSISKDLNKICLKDYKCDKNCRRALVTIIECRNILMQSEKLLTRHQENLNNLWRVLTRVRIMIIEALILPDMLPFQLYFCREEARRLAVNKEPEVQDMLQKLAEACNEDAVKKEKLVKFKSLLRELHERFLTIRTDRIHQQYVNIRTYKSALLFLFPISITLIAISSIIFSTNNIPEPSNSIWSLFSIKNNILLFVCFGGLAGGFFSVTTRLRDKDLIPGQDAYYVWYVLSKPFVGALGAALLYIIVRGGLIETQLIADTTKLVNHDALTFGFSVIAGFSERILLPTFR